MEYFLRNWLGSPHILLNEYIKGHTSCLPGNTGEPFISNEPNLQFTVRMLGFEWERLEMGRLVLQLPIPPFEIWVDSSTVIEAVQIVQFHLPKG